MIVQDTLFEYLWKVNKNAKMHLKIIMLELLLYETVSLIYNYKCEWNVVFIHPFIANIYCFTYILRCF